MTQVSGTSVTKREPKPCMIPGLVVTALDGSSLVCSAVLEAGARWRWIRPLAAVFSLGGAGCQSLDVPFAQWRSGYDRG